MALATRPKPKTHDRKRVAKHHKHTPHYLKTYWPYLPALAIVGIGYLVNQALYSSDSLAEAGANLQGVTTPTRVEALTGNSNGIALTIVIIMAVMALGIFLFQQWFRVQRTLNRGEAFVARHPWLDLVLVVLATAGVILTRQAI